MSRLSSFQSAFRRQMDTLPVCTPKRGHSELIGLAVPEPETHALMLTGLGITGWVARRTKRQQAAD